MIVQQSWWSLTHWRRLYTLILYYVCYWSFVIRCCVFIYSFMMFFPALKEKTLFIPILGFVEESFLAAFLLWCLVNGFYIWLCSRAGWSLTHWRGFYNFILYYVCFDLLLSDAVFSFIGCFFLPLRKKLFLYQYWDLSKNLFWQPF